MVTPDLLALADEYEAGLNKCIASGYEEFGAEYQQRHRMVIDSLRFRAHAQGPLQSMAWREVQELWEAISGPSPRCRDCADSDGTCCNDRERRPCDPHARALYDLAKMKAALRASEAADAGAVAAPVMWVCFAADSQFIRAWTKDGVRAARFADEGLDMMALYASPTAAGIAAPPTDETQRDSADLQAWLRHGRIGTGRGYQAEVERARKIEADLAAPPAASADAVSSLQITQRSPDTDAAKIMSLVRSRLKFYEDNKSKLTPEGRHGALVLTNLERDLTELLARSATAPVAGDDAGMGAIFGLFADENGMEWLCSEHAGKVMVAKADDCTTISRDLFEQWGWCVTSTECGVGGQRS